VSQAGPLGPTEMMIHLLSREVRDKEVSATGTLSPIPAAACYLAQLTHAPQAKLAILDAPDWPFDGELEELFNMVQRGRVGLFFLSGAQIDQEANINLVAIGQHHRPQVRLPGGAGSAMVYLHSLRVALFLRHQSARNLVKRVDFVTAPGGGPGPGRPGGPTRLVTDLAAFDYRPDKGLALTSIHPWTTPREVQERTGFDLGLTGREPLSEEPGPEILELIHGPVKERLARVYPLFAEEL